jgi:hypothetical protein
MCKIPKHVSWGIPVLMVTDPKIWWFCHFLASSIHRTLSAEAFCKVPSGLCNSRSPESMLGNKSFWKQIILFTKFLTHLFPITYMLFVCTLHYFIPKWETALTSSHYSDKTGCAQSYNKRWDRKFGILRGDTETFFEKVNNIFPGNVSWEYLYRIQSRQQGNDHYFVVSQHSTQLENGNTRE